MNKKTDFTARKRMVEFKLRAETAEINEEALRAKVNLLTANLESVRLQFEHEVKCQKQLLERVRGADAEIKLLRKFLLASIHEHAGTEVGKNAPNTEK